MFYPLARQARACPDVRLLNLARMRVATQAHTTTALANTCTYSRPCFKYRTTHALIGLLRTHIGVPKRRGTPGQGVRRTKAKRSTPAPRSAKVPGSGTPAVVA